MLTLVGNHGLVSDMKNDGMTLAPKGMNDSHRCHQGVKVCFTEIPSNFLHLFSGARPNPQNSSNIPLVTGTLAFFQALKAN